MYHDRTTRRLLPHVFLLLALVLLAGCRTYGKRGNEEASFKQMVAAVENFEQTLNQAEVNLATLEEAGQDQPALRSFVSPYQALVRTHRSLLVMQRERIEQLRDSDSYRDLSRSLGATVTEQASLMKQYRALAARAQRTADTTVTALEVPPESRYYMVPPYYERVRNAPEWGFPRMNLETGREMERSGATATSDTSTAAPSADTTR